MEEIASSVATPIKPVPVGDRTILVEIQPAETKMIYIGAQLSDPTGLSSEIGAKLGDLQLGLDSLRRGGYDNRLVQAGERLLGYIDRVMREGLLERAVAGLVIAKNMVFLREDARVVPGGPNNPSVTVSASTLDFGSTSGGFVPVSNAWVQLVHLLHGHEHQMKVQLMNGQATVDVSATNDYHWDFRKQAYVKELEPRPAPLEIHVQDTASRVESFYTSVPAPPA